MFLFAAAVVLDHLVFDIFIVVVIVVVITPVALVSGVRSCSDFLVSRCFPIDLMVAIFEVRSILSEIKTLFI